MEFLGERFIAASRAAVWAGLDNPEILKAAVPGCSEMTGSIADGYNAVVSQKIGPVKVTLGGAISLSNVVAAERYRIKAQGTGTVGFAKAVADVTLSDAPGGTLLRYTADAAVGGTLARLGARLVGPVVRKFGDRFFADFETAINEN